MRLLFDMDRKDYDPNGTAFVRPSARAIVIKNGKVAMVHSVKYDYYKFPGGGIESNESKEQALIRETREEAGLTIIPESIKEFGYVHRIQKSEYDDVECFVQDNYYYLVETEDEIVMQELDDYEDEERFTLEWMRPDEAIDTNRNVDHGPKDQLMLEREARVLEILMQENYL